MWGQRWFSSGSSGSRTRYAHKALAVAKVLVSTAVLIGAGVVVFLVAERRKKIVTV